MAIETVFLDAGGVLVFPNWARVSEALARRGVHVAPETLASAEPAAKREFDTSERFVGTTDTQRSFPYFNMVLAKAGLPQDAATDAALDELHAYHDRHNLWETSPAPVGAALARLGAGGRRLAVISNANGTIASCLARIGLASHFDLILDSKVEGVEKPDARFFHLALERLGADAASTIHVGDIYHVDVVGARNAGIRPILLDSHGLYPDADCPRVATLAELADRIERE